MVEHNDQSLSLALTLYIPLKFINDRKAEILFVFCYRQLSQKLQMIYYQNKELLKETSMWRVFYEVYE